MILFRGRCLVMEQLLRFLSKRRARTRIAMRYEEYLIRYTDLQWMPYHRTDWWIATSPNTFMTFVICIPSNDLASTRFDATHFEVQQPYSFIRLMQRRVQVIDSRANASTTSACFTQLGYRVQKPVVRTVIETASEYDTEIELTCPTSNATIHYTLNGSIPTKHLDSVEVRVSNKRGECEWTVRSLNVDIWSYGQSSSIGARFTCFTCLCIRTSEIIQWYCH